ncbi:ankyrin repeat-containing protein, putative [Entamoeba invadens IP1]|uniref:ankyrin repeat-containing protein, putative n=1 Tax=Entamoeba invadens IP1 TaxID=370355 RepID=UPI0002C3EC5D|nr:ankyrin repeat-containing protein, putative [Entamoeba invadens IP1]ELP93795.1 ankyrin repeat-containing protein, putative [Entamoeba invadens IP1]|eukprot:XP_004260566.1 ankyrin repeat-containing protein, putative [Entamoeba invadens IP1]
MEDESVKICLDNLLKDRELVVDYFQHLLVDNKPSEVETWLKSIDCKTWMKECKRFPKFFHCIVALAPIKLVHLVIVLFPTFIDIKNVKGSTPIFTAMENRRDETVKLLVEAGASLVEKNDEGNTLLHLLSQRSGAFVNDIVTDILQVNPELINTQNIYGETPLHIACLTGNTEVIQLYLKNKVDVNRTTECGQSVLQYALESPRYSQIKTLIAPFLEEKKESIFCTETEEMKMIKSLSFLKTTKPPKSSMLKNSQSDSSVKHTQSTHFGFVSPLRLLGTAAKLSASKIFGQKAKDLSSEIEQLKKEEKIITFVFEPKLRKRVIVVNVNNMSIGQFAEIIKNTTKVFNQLINKSESIVCCVQQCIVLSSILTNTFDVLYKTIPLISGINFNMEQLQIVSEEIFEKTQVVNLPREFYVCCDTKEKNQKVSDICLSAFAEIFEQKKMTQISKNYLVQRFGKGASYIVLGEQIDNLEKESGTILNVTIEGGNIKSDFENVLKWVEVNWR